MKSEWKSYKDESRMDWGAEFNPGKNPSRDQLRFGLEMRIADAVEMMAKNHAQLIRERDNAVENVQFYRNIVHARDRTISALRGQITRLKKRIAAMEEDSGR